jgi:uncharacterized membrane protein
LRAIIVESVTSFHQLVCIHKRIIEPARAVRAILRQAYILAAETLALTHMPDDHSTIHHVLRVLLWALTGILLTAVTLLVLATIMPAFSRAWLQLGSVSESFREASRSMMVGLGDLGSAIFGLIFAIVVILILVGIGLAILESTPSRQHKPRDEALEALKLRYANGEITKQQFLEMKKTLTDEE